MAADAMAPNAVIPKESFDAIECKRSNIKEPDFHLTDLCYRNVMENPTSLAVGTR
jgi:hypothetical protein